jgi:hypothetical protein
MPEITGGAADITSIRSAVQKNVESGKYDAGHFKIPLIGIGIPAGPFADKNKAMAYEQMQKDVDDALEIYRKARAMMNGLESAQT